ncbi:MAG: site-2 protease family protein, partial [Vicinamibacteria bacterium]|nr:site-2 protease family protein [Vicinamibacteria bacterium]
FLHWSWFIVAVYQIQWRLGRYSSFLWNVLEYLALFAIVTMHELGHSLACRQAGGRANQIVLWPLGGVAYVDPPQRPGATLWSIAAGPLVNIVLLPVLTLLIILSRFSGLVEAVPDAYALLSAIWIMNLLVLVFNLLPIYPLDGGQILRSLLWFVLGRARSLSVASLVGFAGVAGLVVLALYSHSIWIGVIAAFVALSCWRGFQSARVLSKMDRLARRTGFSCPSCKAAPPIGAFWVCGLCRNAFDIFESGAVCPHCHARFPASRCVDCGRLSPTQEWATFSAFTPPL